MALPNATATVTLNPINDAPIVDVNGSSTTGINQSVTWTESSGTTGTSKTNTAINIFGAAELIDIDNQNIGEATIEVRGLRDKNAEALTIASSTFNLSNNYTDVPLNNGFNLNYTANDGIIRLLPTNGTTATKTSLQSLIREITYNNTSSRPTDNISLHLKPLETSSTYRPAAPLI